MSSSRQRPAENDEVDVLSRVKRTLADYRALDSRAWTLALVRTINTGGLSLVMVFMGIYMVSDRGLSLTEYGLIVLLTSAVQSWAQGFAGIISDRVGRRPVMTTALGVRTAVICGLGLAVILDAPVLAITAILVVSSSLRGAFEPVAYAFVADVVEPGERVSAFGLQRLGTNLGWAVGPAAGGALLAVAPYGVVFFCAAPFLLVSAIIVWRLKEPPRVTAAQQGRPSVLGALVTALGNKTGALFLLGVFLTAVSHLQLFTTLSVYAKESLVLSEAAVGGLYTVNAAVVLALQIPAVALINHLGARRALVLGAALFTASFLLIGVASTFVGAGLGVAVLTLGEILLAPAQQAVVAELSGSDAYGRAFGVMGTVTMLGVAAGPILGGLAFDALAGDGMIMWATLAAFPASTMIAFAWFGARARVAES